MSEGQETIETIETQTLHAKLCGTGLKEGYSENVVGSYKDITEYCRKNKFEVGHFYDYSDLNTIHGEGYFKFIGSKSEYLVETKTK